MIGVSEIRRIIPHRYPILLVDAVSEVEPGSRLIAHKAITGREPCFAGLADEAAPEEYAYPISLLLESWAQAAVLLARWEQPNPDVRSGQVELLAGIRKAELMEPVYPGQVLRHHVQLLRAVDNAVILGGSSETDGRTVLRVGEFIVAPRPLVELPIRPKAADHGPRRARS